MSKKVLGFYPEDSSNTFFCAEGVYIVPERKLVRVVSLKALKKWCKEEMDAHTDRTDDFERGVHDILEELLAWARGQAEAKKE